MAGYNLSAVYKWLLHCLPDLKTLLQGLQMYKSGTLKYELEVIVHPKDTCDVLNSL